MYNQYTNFIERYKQLYPNLKLLDKKEFTKTLVNDVLIIELNNSIGIIDWYKTNGSKDRILSLVKKYQNKYDKIIIVSSKKKTKSNITVSDKVTLENIEMYNFNPLNYIYTPKHEIITEEIPYEKNKLPQIKASDRVINWIFGKPGDIIKVIIPCHQNSFEIAYRQVI